MTRSEKPFCLWRAISVGVLVSSVAIAAGAWWLDEVLTSFALVPIILGAILVATGRTAGVLVLLIGATPALVLLAVAAPLSEPDFLWLLCPAVGAVVTFCLLLPRLLRFDRAATVIAVLLSLILGIGTVVFEAEVVMDRVDKYWRWQGQREARRDWAGGRLNIRGGRPSAAQAAVLERYGISVKEIAGCVMKAKPAMHMIGYNDTAREFIKARFGMDLRTGCDSDRGVGIVPEVRPFEAMDTP